MKIKLSRKWAADLGESHPTIASFAMFGSILINLAILFLIGLFLFDYLFFVVAHGFSPIAIGINHLIVYSFIALFAALISVTALAQRFKKPDLSIACTILADLAFLALLFYLVTAPLVIVVSTSTMIPPSLINVS